MHESDLEDQDSLLPLPMSSDVPAPLWRGFGEAIISTAGVEYNTELLGVQSKLDALLIADKANPFTRSRFASLGQLLATVKPVLNRHRFILRQFSGTIRSHGAQTKRWYSLPVITLITHVPTGQYEAIVIDLPIETTIYALGGGLTFGKRYGLQSYLGIATVDDDGAQTILNKLEDSSNEKILDTAKSEIKKCKSIEELQKWLDENRDSLNNLNEKVLTTIRESYLAQKASFGHGILQSERVRTAEDAAAAAAAAAPADEPAKRRGRPPRQGS
jgi:hypothetical protein